MTYLCIISARQFFSDSTIAQYAYNGSLSQNVVVVIVGQVVLNGANLVHGNYNLGSTSQNKHAGLKSQ